MSHQSTIPFNRYDLIVMSQLVANRIAEVDSAVANSYAEWQSNPYGDDSRRLWLKYKADAQYSTDLHVLWQKIDTQIDLTHF